MGKIKKGIVCYFDGACEPKNPGGNMGIGAVIFIDGVEQKSYSAYVPAQPSNSNNVAEYMAFIWALTALKDMGMCAKEIHVYGDSNLVIQQMSGSWRIKEGRYVEYAKQGWQLRCLFPNIRLSWIPRDKNKYADELSKAELIKHKVKFKIQPNN